MPNVKSIMIEVKRKFSKQIEAKHCWFTTIILSLVDVFRSACHALASTEDSRYVPDDPTTKKDGKRGAKKFYKGHNT